MRPHLILIVDGGIIHEALSNTAIDYTVIDYDVQGTEEEHICDMPRQGYGQEAYCSSHGATVDAEQTEQLLARIEAEQTDRCDKCGEAVHKLIGCPDGRELCAGCFGEEGQ